MNKPILLHTSQKNDFLNGISIIENMNIEISEIYSTIPVDDIKLNKKLPKTFIPAIGLIFGLLGALGGFGLQYWVNNIAYPLNFGGKPLLAFPSFIPTIFECAILCSALAMIVVFLTTKRNRFQNQIDKLLALDQFIICVENNEENNKLISNLQNQDSFKLKRYFNNE